jgi:hypothetical protein
MNTSDSTNMYVALAGFILNSNKIPSNETARYGSELTEIAFWGIPRDFFYYPMAIESVLEENGALRAKCNK